MAFKGDYKFNTMCQVSHMTPVALPQHRAGAGPNKSPVPSSWNWHSINISCTFPFSYKNLYSCEKGTCYVLVSGFQTWDTYPRYNTICISPTYIKI